MLEREVIKFLAEVDALVAELLALRDGRAEYVAPAIESPQKLPAPAMADEWKLE